MWWKWLQLDHMQIICTLLQTDNHANTSSLNFYRPDALPDAQPTMSKHWRHKRCTQNVQNKHAAMTDKDTDMRLRQNKAWRFETEPRQDDKTYKCREWAETKIWKTKMSRDKTLLETTSLLSGNCQYSRVICVLFLSVRENCGVQWQGWQMWRYYYHRLQPAVRQWYSSSFYMLSTVFHSV